MVKTSIELVKVEKYSFLYSIWQFYVRMGPKSSTYLDKLQIYLNAKVSQLLLKCYFLLFEPNILLHDIVINMSNDLPSKQHENQTSETYDC